MEFCEDHDDEQLRKRKEGSLKVRHEEGGGRAGEGAGATCKDSDENCFILLFYHGSVREITL